MNPSVSVIIVNYNGLHFLDECFTSLRNSFSKYRYEVIVVDNGSSDGSQSYLRTRDDIHYIESAVNTGFTGGNNLGVASATGEVILLLNNDTKVQTSLDPLIDRLFVPGIGVAGCQLRYGDGRIQFSVGYEHTPARIILSWLGLEKMYAMPQLFRRLETAPAFYAMSKGSVAWVSGACFATKKALWDSLAGFDDNFFMYCEDVDYCQRVRDRGLSVSYVAESVVTHYEGAGKEWIGVAALLRTLRSYYYYVVKHFGPGTARATIGALSIVFALRAALFTALAGITSKENVRQLRFLKARGFAKAFREAIHAAATGSRPSLP